MCAQLDELAKRVDAGFEKVDQDMKAGFAKVDERFERLYRLLFVSAVSIVAALIAALAAALAT
ncbi:MAG: hypothetical protein ACTHK3_12700 [Solirubrobacterales bacterium]